MYACMEVMKQAKKLEKVASQNRPKSSIESYACRVASHMLTQKVVQSTRPTILADQQDQPCGVLIKLVIYSTAHAWLGSGVHSPDHGSHGYNTREEGVRRVMMTVGNLRQQSNERAKDPCLYCQAGKPAESLKMTSQSRTTKSDPRSGNLALIQ